MKIQNQGFDHVEFVVADIAAHAAMYKRMGFEKVGERSLPKRGLKSELYAQGVTRVLLTQYGSAAPVDEKGFQFFRRHGDGITVLAIDVDDASQAFKDAVKNGARPAMEPKRFESPQGSVTRAEIFTPEDLRYALIERKGPADVKAPALFDEGLVAARLESPTPGKIWKIDHLTNNVGIGEMKTWVEWYKKTFGFVVSRHFDIRTGRTGLISDVIESPCRKIKVPINEATEPESQVQEFVVRFKGPGVQHLALETTEITDTLSLMRKSGFKFLTVPHTYYEAVPTRVPGVTEDLAKLEELGILLDGEETGYLLQVFSEEAVGPFFFELIQRKGNQGFGEGNFRALFEAIERDQVKRGVLRA